MSAKKSSALTENIPEHLTPYIVDQDPSLYTPIDHACWRFILRVSKRYFAQHAHKKYLDGLEETGISTERIPLVSEMDAKLRRFGWRAVAVSGFIPPSIFMEMQSLGILAIACDMRTHEHLAYTPAPDIVHEAAGHAPIIADPDYAAYLRSYGQVARKAIFSKQDTEIYEAIRHLSIVKENPESTPRDIAEAQARLDRAVAHEGSPSEAALLARMNWWTVEYGLIGSLDSPKIYGAGLLSSVGESYSCLKSGVKKVPMTVGCVEVSYDITRPQPQLFVTPDFETLKRVLDEFAGTMAFRVGGVAGLEKAQRAGEVTTVQLDSGIQISGVLGEFLRDRIGQPSYLQFRGPTQLAFGDEQIKKQGPEHHREGFGTAVGALEEIGKPVSDLDASERKALGLVVGEKVTLSFESGVKVTGTLRSLTERDDVVVIASFDECRVTLGGTELFKPEWGVYDMACGRSVASVFGGAADRLEYARGTGGIKKIQLKPKTNLTDGNRELCALYGHVREVRERDQAPTLAALEPVVEYLERRYPEEWLLRLEMLELNADYGLKAPWADGFRRRLQEIGLLADPATGKKEMIDRGLELVG